jgi:hypothetical protein
MHIQVVVVVGLQIPVPEITGVATPTSALVTAPKGKALRKTAWAHAHPGKVPSQDCMGAHLFRQDAAEVSMGACTFRQDTWKDCPGGGHTVPVGVGNRFLQGQTLPVLMPKMAMGCPEQPLNNL